MKAEQLPYCYVLKVTKKHHVESTYYLQKLTPKLQTIQKSLQKKKPIVSITGMNNHAEL
jgi:hypothetical protein